MNNKHEDNEGTSQPMAPPRRKNPGRIKEEGVDMSAKKVRPVAIVKDAISIEHKEVLEKGLPNTKKGPRPPRPPPPLRPAGSPEQNISISNGSNDSSPKLKQKPSIPVRPIVSKENVATVTVCQPIPAVRNVITNENDTYKIPPNNEKTLNTDCNINHEVSVPRKPKPKPRPRPRPDKTIDLKSIPPRPQPRKSFNENCSKEKSSDESAPCLEITSGDTCLSSQANEKVSECVTELSKEIETVPLKIKDSEENDFCTTYTKDSDEKKDKTEISLSEDVFYAVPPNNKLHNDIDSLDKEEIYDCAKKKVLEESLNCTLILRGQSFGTRRPENCIRKMKRSLSESDLDETQQNFEQYPSKEGLLNSLVSPNKGQAYENIKLKEKCDILINRATMPPYNTSKSLSQHDTKQTQSGHSYENVGLKDNQASPLSDSLVLLQRLNNYPVFYVPKIYPKSDNKERNLSNSCDTVYVDGSNIAEDIYSIPTNNRDCENDIYAIPPSNQIADPYRDFLLPSSNRLSSGTSDRSSAASRESARFSVASNSSHSSNGEKQQAYENVGLPNGDQTIPKDKYLSNERKPDGDVSCSPGRKQKRTNSRRDMDDIPSDGRTPYMNMPSPAVEIQDSYIELDFTTQNAKTKIGNTQKPRVPKLPSNCFLPTKLLEENENFLKRQRSAEKAPSGRVSKMYDETTGEYVNYFESSDEEEEVQEKPKSKLYSIANEILTTEKSFVDGLQLICEDFGSALKLAAERNSKLLPDGAYQSMFLNIEQIYELDKKFLQELEDRMKQWELHQRIGDLIREYGHFLKMYTVYIKGYDAAMLIFHDCLTNNMKFLQIVTEFERSSKAKNMKLSSFFLKPIQRIPSYRLLLKDYLDHLPENHLDYKDISDGLDIVSEVASHINESMKEGEKFQEVLRIQSQITNCKDIVKPGRYLIKEGTLQKLSRKELQQREFILFTDALLYCSCVGSQLKLINELPLVGMTVQIPDSQDLNNEFVVISTKRSFLLNARSAKEREEWVAALEGAVQVANEKVGTFVIKNDGTTMLNAELGQIAPPWIPDSRVTMCQICAVAFTIYNRRHHCRACGKVVCNDCSSFEAPLRYMDNEVARVCSICYDQLYDQHASESSPANRLLSYKFKDLKGKKRKNKLKNLPSALTEVTAQEEGIQNSGFLRVKKGTKKEKRCWFVLKDYVLYMYKASSDPAASSTTPVLGYQVRVAGNWDEEDFVFTLSHPGLKETIVLRAENRTSAERWLHCLLQATELAT